VVALGLSAAVVEAGCLILWAISPQLTAIYNADFSAAFFARAPMLQTADQLVLRGLGPLGEPAPDPPRMVVDLEAGLALMMAGYVGGLVVVHAHTAHCRFDGSEQVVASGAKPSSSKARATP
jgi:hypothetical protein